MLVHHAHGYHTAGEAIELAVVDQGGGGSGDAAVGQLCLAPPGAHGLLLGGLGQLFRVWQAAHRGGRVGAEDHVPLGAEQLHLLLPAPLVGLHIVPGQGFPLLLGGVAGIDGEVVGGGGGPALHICEDIAVVVAADDRGEGNHHHRQEHHQEADAVEQPPPADALGLEKGDLVQDFGENGLDSM